MVAPQLFRKGFLLLLLLLFDRLVVLLFVEVSAFQLAADLVRKLVYLQLKGLGCFFLGCLDLMSVVLFNLVEKLGLALSSHAMRLF